MKQSLLDKEKEAVRFIKKAESLAMRMSEQCFQWWISNENATHWLNKNKQPKLF